MKRELATQRALQLAEDLANDEQFGSLAAVERYWDMGTGYMSRLRTETDRNIGESAMRKIRARMNLRAEFFTDPTLGDRPDYRDFIGRGALEPHVEPVDEEVRTVVRQYLEGLDPDDPRRPSADEARWLDGLSFRELRASGLEVTPALLDRLLRERRAQEAGKLREAPVVEPPPVRPGRRKLKR